MARTQEANHRIAPHQLLYDRQLIRSVNHLSFMKENCDALSEYFNVMIERTYCCAPVRTSDWRLDRNRHPSKSNPDTPERALEMAIYRANSLKESEFLKGICKRVVSYQVPIKQTSKDKAGKAIDLLGVSDEGGPVVIELKVGNCKETPLRMLVEAISYAVVIRKAWNEGDSIREQWSAMAKEPPNAAKAPGRLLKEVPIIGMAPAEYWNKCLGKYGPHGKVKVDAWRAFGKLVRTCRDRGFPAHFVQFATGKKGEDGLPSVTAFESVSALNQFIR